MAPILFGFRLGSTRCYGLFLVLRFVWDLARMELNLSSVLGRGLLSVLSVERSETNVAISIIRNRNIAVSQTEPASMSSGGRLG